MQVRPLPSTPSRRSSGERAPPSEGGRRTFESCRRGRANPALGATHGRDPAGSGARLLTGYGVTPVRVRVSPLPPLPRKRPGWMRSLSRKQVRVSRPLGVRVAPLPLSPRSSSGHDAGFSSRKPGFDSPSRYATPLPGGPAARMSGCYPEDESSIPSLAAHIHVVVVQRRGPRHATPAMGVRFPPTTPRYTYT